MNRKDEHAQYKAAAIQGILASGTGGEIKRIVDWAEKIADKAVETDSPSREDDPVKSLAWKHGWSGQGTAMQFLDDRLDKASRSISRYVYTLTRLNELADSRGDQWLKETLKQLEGKE